MPNMELRTPASSSDDEIYRFAVTDQPAGPAPPRPPRETGDGGDGSITVKLGSPTPTKTVVSDPVVVRLDVSDAPLAGPEPVPAIITAGEGNLLSTGMTQPAAVGSLETTDHRGDFAAGKSERNGQHQCRCRRSARSACAEATAAAAQTRERAPFDAGLGSVAPRSCALVIGAGGRDVHVDGHDQEARQL